MTASRRAADPPTKELEEADSNFSEIMSRSGLAQDPGSTAALTVLKRALDLESESRGPQALVCYQEGIDLLLQVLKGEQ